MTASHRTSHRRGFTLVELLVVIGIIAVLIGILMPALSAARKQANTLKCLAHLRGIGQAFKLYANDSRDFWPVGRQDYPDTGTSLPNATLPGTGNKYWPDELLKYVSRAGSGIQESATGGENGSFAETQKSVIWGCPEWNGRGNIYGSAATSLYVNGVYIYEGGYAMNIYTAYKPNYPKQGSVALTSKELAQRSETVWGSGQQGRRYKQVHYTSSDKRMVLTDSTLWLLRFQPCTTLDQIQAEPLFGTDQTGAGATTIDRYRHGKYPKPIGSVFDKSGGKVAFNILYADGHAATANTILDGY